MSRQTRSIGFMLSCIFLFQGLLAAQGTLSFSVHLISPSNNINCLQSSVKFIAASSYSGQVNYVWNGPGGTTYGANVQLTNQGSYTVIASASNMSSTTSTFSIGQNFVNPPSTLSPLVQSMNCSNSSVANLFAGATTATNVTHQFLSPIGGACMFSSVSVTYKPGGPGTYTHVLIDNTNGCKTIKTFTVNGTGFPTFSLQSPQNYTLGCGVKSIIDINISGASTTPTSGGALSYTLIGPGSGSVSGGNLSTATLYTVSQAGTYTALTRDNTTQCDRKTVFTILQNNFGPNYKVIVPTQVLDCNTALTHLQVASTDQATSFLWSTPSNPSITSAAISVNSNTAAPTSTLATTYTLQVFNDNNTCGSSTLIPIYQNIFAPNALINSGIGVPKLSCFNPTVVLSHNSISGIPATSIFSSNLPVVAVSWKGPPPQTSANYTSVYGAYTSGIYTLNVIDQNNGCKGWDSIAVFDWKFHPVVNNPNGPTPFCINQDLTSTQIYAITSGNSSNYTYQWTAPSSATISGANTPTLTANSLGIYSVVVTNPSSGCSTLGQVIINFCYTKITENSSDKINVKVYPNPSNGLFYIDMDLNQEGLEFRIYNYLGVLISKNPGVLNGAIHIGTEVKGMFYLYILKDSVPIHFAKLIKD